MFLAKPPSRKALIFNKLTQLARLTQLPVYQWNIKTYRTIVNEIQSLINESQDKLKQNNGEKHEGTAYYEYYVPIDNVKKDLIFGLAIFKFIHEKLEIKKIKVRINESIHYLQFDEIQFLLENIKSILNKSDLHKDQTFRRFHVSYNNNYFQISAKQNTKFLVRTISIQNEKTPLSEKEVQNLCSILQKSLDVLSS